MLHKSEADLETSIENLSLFPNRSTICAAYHLRISVTALLGLTQTPRERRHTQSQINFLFFYNIAPD